MGLTGSSSQVEETCSSPGAPLPLSRGLVPQLSACPAMQVGTCGERGLSSVNAKSKRQASTEEETESSYQWAFFVPVGAGVLQYGRETQLWDGTDLNVNPALPQTSWVTSRDLCFLICVVGTRLGAVRPVNCAAHTSSTSATSSSSKVLCLYTQPWATLRGVLAYYHIKTLNKIRPINKPHQYN